MMDLSYFEPVEDKSGYYWLNKRNHQVISEKLLKKMIEEYNKNCNKLLRQNNENNY